jgi:hypothetical protein
MALFVGNQRRLVIALDDFVSLESDVMAVYPLNSYVPVPAEKLLDASRFVRNPTEGVALGPRFGRRW